MMFVTGMEEEPVLGFGVEPSLCFNDVDKVSGFYPTANTLYMHKQTEDPKANFRSTTSNGKRPI